MQNGALVYGWLKVKVHIVAVVAGALPVTAVTNPPWSVDPEDTVAVPLPSPVEVEIVGAAPELPKWPLANTDRIETPLEDATLNNGSVEVAEFPTTSSIAKLEASVEEPIIILVKVEEATDITKVLEA